MTEYEQNLKMEYARAKATLIQDEPIIPKDYKAKINTVIMACDLHQTTIIIKELSNSYQQGVTIQSDYLAKRVPAYTTFKLGPAPTHLKKIRSEYIGHIGDFNKQLATNLKWEYSRLLNNNEFMLQLEEHGWTKHVEKRARKAGLSSEQITLLKKQTTTTKMITLLEEQGIKRGTSPEQVARYMRPAIRDFFGEGGVEIDNIGKIRKELRVNSEGRYWWKETKVTHKWRSTVNNYSDMIARTSQLRAHNAGRYESVEKSKLVEKYRYICACTGNSCDVCIGMHGAIVDPNDVSPPIHPQCGCSLSPVWTEAAQKAGLVNHTDEFYTNQQNTALYKRYELKRYNETHEIPLKNVNYLGDLGDTPTGAKMDTIRKSILG